MSLFFQEKPEGFVPKVEVAACCVESCGEILFLQRADGEVAPYLWAIPGGKLEAGETPQEAIIRELNEELDILFSPCQISFFNTLYVRHPLLNYNLHCFGMQLQSQPKIRLHPEEHVDFRWCTRKQIETLDLIEGQLDVFERVYDLQHR